MQRLLDGRPLHSDGKLTVKSLAVEAQLKRWLLTHKHTDLQDEFRTRVRSHGEIPEAFKDLATENAALTAKVSKLAADLSTARQTISRLERVVQVVALENDRQTSHRQEPPSSVTPIRGG